MRVGEHARTWECLQGFLFYRVSSASCRRTDDNELTLDYLRFCDRLTLRHDRFRLCTRTPCGAWGCYCTEQLSQ